jgi:hypothetical protein
MYYCEYIFLIRLALQVEACEECLRHQFFSEHILSRKTPADIDKTKITTTLQSTLDAPVRSNSVETATKSLPGGRPSPSMRLLWLFALIKCSERESGKCIKGNYRRGFEQWIFIHLLVAQVWGSEEQPSCTGGGEGPVLCLNFRKWLLIVPQMNIRIFSAFYRTQRFICVLERTSSWTLHLHQIHVLHGRMRP